MTSYDDLIAAARGARAAAYAPYSKYLVGAAVRATDGRLFAGANVENASYGLAVCAERNAIMSAVLAGSRELDAIAIVTSDTPPSPPCGMCLQTLAEFVQDLHIVLAEPAGGTFVVHRLSQLLPHPFRIDTPAPKTSTK